MRLHQKPISIGLVADGDPQDRRTNSGVARNLLDGLLEQEDVSLAFAGGTQPRGIDRALLAAITFSLDRDLWKRKLAHGPATRAYRSKKRTRLVEEHPGVEFLIHARNVYTPESRVPYAAFIDTTSVLASEWAGWRGGGLANKLRAAEKDYFREAAIIFTAGKLAASSVVEDYGVPDHRVVTVGGGTNYRVPPVQASLASPPGALRLLFVGLDGRRKGLDTAVEAVELARSVGINASLTVVGSGDAPQRPWITSVGPLWDRDVLSATYAAHDAFLFPARHEPYGLVVQEAMAHGLPVISSNVGELASIVIATETGFCHSPEEARVYAESIELLASSPALRRTMGTLARARAYSQFSWDAVAGRMSGVIRKHGEVNGR